MVNYAFYRNMYKGTALDEETFEALAVRANFELQHYENIYTIKYWDNANGRNLAICALAEETQVSNSATSLSAENGQQNIKSVSIGSVSTSFNTLSALEVLQSKTARHMKALRLYAHVYRGVKRC